MSNHTSSAIQGSKLDVRKLVTMAMLSAIGVMLVAVIEVPLLPAAPFLKYDPADIPILIGTLLYGSAAGCLMTVVVSFIQSFMIHGSSGIVGFFMHVVATSAMVIAAGMVYSHSKKNMLSAASALGAGTIAMTVGMIGMNLIVTPAFMGVPFEVVVKMLVPTIIPFNLLKAGINSIAAFLVYRVVEKIVKR